MPLFSQPRIDRQRSNPRKTVMRNHIAVITSYSIHYTKLYDGGSIRILVDFAHNEHGMRALSDTVRRVDAERVILLMGQAGDRSDRDIAELVRAACEMRPTRLLVAELPGYERGRQPFEVPELIRQDAISCGQDSDRIEICDGPREATRAALQQAQP